MRFQPRGIILIDVLTALSLGILFVAIIGQAYNSARSLFYKAKDTDRLLDDYQVGRFGISESLYGNDRLENIISLGSSTNTLIYDQVFSRSLVEIGEVAGTPLCAVDFTFGQKVQPTTTVIRLPVNPLLPLTHLEVRNQIAYISADSAVASDPDLFIVDFHDPALPAVVSSINTGPGISSFVVAGRRIFAAAASTAAQLHVIRLDGLSKPVLESKYQLVLPYATATPAMASAIAYKRGKVYLGTEKWDGEELSLIEVTDPAHPVRRSGFEIGSKVNDILVVDSLAYLASADLGQLRIVDFHDLANPRLVGTFSPSGWSRQEGKSILFFEGALGLGRTSGGFNLTSDHEVFVWATTSAENLISPTSLDIAGGVYGIVADRSHFYLATRQAGRELQIFDRNLSIASSSAFTLPISPQSLTCDNDKIYILAHSGPYIYAISFP